MEASPSGRSITDQPISAPRCDEPDLEIGDRALELVDQGRAGQVEWRDPHLGRGVGADLVGDRFQHLPPPRGDHDVDAVGRDPARVRGADSLRGTRDEGPRSVAVGEVSSCDHAHGLAESQHHRGRATWVGVGRPQ